MKVSNLKEKTVGQSAVEANYMVLPSNTNAIGTIFGGAIMGWIDVTAAICAQRHSGSICVTASVDALSFLHPVKVGDTVTLLAKIVNTGRSSMVVHVDVSAENPVRNKSCVKCVEAFLTFVALDASGKPTDVPKLKISNPQEQAAFDAAAKRKAALKALKPSV